MQNNHIYTLFQETLKNNGLKCTKNRNQIFSLLLKTKKPLSATQIRSFLPYLDTSTVYRTLDTFRNANIIHVVPKGFKTLYELSENFIEHHHHITCEKCGRIYPITSAELENIINNLTLSIDMVPTYHNIEIYGICSNCH